jgi:hypothetical protein
MNTYTTSSSIVFYYSLSPYKKGETNKSKVELEMGSHKMKVERKQNMCRVRP